MWLCMLVTTTLSIWKFRREDGRCFLRWDLHVVLAISPRNGASRTHSQSTTHAPQGLSRSHTEDRRLSRTLSTAPGSTGPTTFTFPTPPAISTAAANAASTHTACRTKHVDRLGLSHTGAYVTIRTSPRATNPLHTRHRARPVGAIEIEYEFDRAFIALPTPAPIVCPGTASYAQSRGATSREMR